MSWQPVLPHFSYLRIISGRSGDIRELSPSGGILRAMEGLDEFFRETREATRRRPADVIAADEAEPMSDDDFDTALWLSLCGFAESAPASPHGPTAFARISQLV